MQNNVYELKEVQSTHQANQLIQLGSWSFVDHYSRPRHYPLWEGDVESVYIMARIKPNAWEPQAAG